MAQTKRKRRSKHRGTAAGTIESRGRTGRRPEAGERKPNERAAARERRLTRLDRPPSWRSAANRAVIAAAVFVVAVILLFKQKPSQAIPLGAFMLLIYIPMGYYTDLFLHRRRRRKEGK